MKKTTSLLLVFILLLSALVAVPMNAFALTTDSGSESGGQTLTVPQIHITTENGNGPSLEKADDYVNATITITDTDSSTLTEAVKIKVRGNSTALPSVTKKAFTLKFDSKQDILNMGKAKKWTLLANAFDPTLMRNYIAFDFAQTMGLEFTSQQQYVELWLDDSFRGCYVLTEPVEEGSTRVDIDIESNDGMNDFLVELERTRVEEDTFYFNTGEIRFAVKEPEEPNEKQLQYIQSVMDEVTEAIKSGDRDAISQKIDIPSFTRFYLLNELIKTVDFDFSSVFFYYKDGRLYCGPVWDYDLSSGNANPEYSQVAKDASMTDGLYASQCNYFKYLCSYDWFKDEVRNTYLQYYDYICNITASGGLMDSLLETYGDVYARNYGEAGWSPSRRWVTLQMLPLATFEANVLYLRNWIEARNCWLAEEYDILPKPQMPGDVDADGRVSIKDATLIQRYLASAATLSQSARVCADTDKDSRISIKDATLIQKFLADLVPQL